MAGKQSVNKGWFSTPGRPGDRTLDQQLNGRLFMEARGKTVLDVGCAEGLISIELAKAGAIAVHGVEIVPEHVKVANKLRGDLPITFEVGDANVWQPKRNYDIVIALAQSDGRVVFHIHADAATKAGLTISSRLLRLAKGTR